MGRNKGTTMVILKSYNEVEPFLEEVQSCSDAHKKEFGFLPNGRVVDVVC